MSFHFVGAPARGRRPSRKACERRSGRLNICGVGRGRAGGNNGNGDGNNGNNGNGNNGNDGNNGNGNEAVGARFFPNQCAQGSHMPFGAPLSANPTSLF